MMAMPQPPVCHLNCPTVMSMFHGLCRNLLGLSIIITTAERWHGLLQEQGNIVACSACHTRAQCAYCLHLALRAPLDGEIRVPDEHHGNGST